MPRDAIWVMPNGVTKVVTVDDDGNLIEDVVLEPEVVAPEKAPDPPAPKKRGRPPKH